MSQRKDAFTVTEKPLAPLLAAKLNAAQYIVAKAGEQFQLIKSWNIYFPLPLINYSAL